MLTVVVTRPLSRDGAWWKTMETQMCGNSPGLVPEVAERQRVAMRKQSGAGHCEMR